jgi:glycosyltransferase involved in cell wall biosynthesis
MLTRVGRTSNDLRRKRVDISTAMAKRRKNVLVVGQTPPPVHGQSLMIQELLNGRYEGLALHHVRLNFSRSTEEIGSFQARKLFVLLKTLVDILVARWRSGAEILYFPPAGPKLNPVIRDVFLLNSTRWLFSSTVFHFHAAGLLEIYRHLPWWLKPLFKRAYCNADVAIVPTKSTAAAINTLNAKVVIVVPNGIPDSAQSHLESGRREIDSVPQILFMGILCEGKGMLTLIEACSRLHDAGLRFRVICAGAFQSDAFGRQVEQLVEMRGLREMMHFPGVLSGDEKVKAFRSADVFCLPSHYHAESFGLVLIEAMSFGLPIVTTRWRGIPEVVGESGGAFIVEPKRPDLLADRLEKLLRDAGLRASMGRRNRLWFCEHYTIEKYRAGMEKALQEVGA